MARNEPSLADRNRWRRDIVRRLEDFPRQYSALKNAMGVFGEDFDLQAFKEAFNTAEDMDAYNRVQAVERAVSRLQNFVAELAEAGVKLAQLFRGPGKTPASAAQQAFEALREAGVIDGRLCRRLTRAQSARSRIEHGYGYGYVDVPAGDVHRTATLVHDAARDFIGPYRAWVGNYLQDVDAGGP
jgi:uncharacterized protein YutE (UPF0331/DUF86 family)